VVALPVVLVLVLVLVGRQGSEATTFLNGEVVPVVGYMSRCMPPRLRAFLILLLTYRATKRKNAAKYVTVGSRVPF